MLNFNDFIEESYLESNFAQIYHFTNNYYLLTILRENVLKVGWFDNPFFGKNVKIVSFTRNNKLNVGNYKTDLNVILCVDKNKMLLDGYKLYPYDYFIQSGKEIHTKSNILRSKPFEFEEASNVDIINIDKYIIYVDFLEDSLFDSSTSINILKKKNIPIYEAGRRLF